MGCIFPYPLYNCSLLLIVCSFVNQLCILNCMYVFSVCVKLMGFQVDDFKNYVGYYTFFLYSVRSTASGVAEDWRGRDLVKPLCVWRNCNDPQLGESEAGAFSHAVTPTHSLGLKWELPTMFIEKCQEMLFVWAVHATLATRRGRKPKKSIWRFILWSSWFVLPPVSLTSKWLLMS